MYNLRAKVTEIRGRGGKGVISFFLNNMYIKMNSQFPAKLAEATAQTGRLIWENRGKISGVTVEEWWLKIKKNKLMQQRWLTHLTRRQLKCLRR